MSDITTPALNRDGGEQPAWAEGRRPMTGDELVAFVQKVAPILGDTSKVDVEADGLGGIKVTLWPDDEEGGVVTFAPIKAVTT